jgi:hypothetical protein
MPCFFKTSAGLMPDNIRAGAASAARWIVS